MKIFFREFGKGKPVVVLHGLYGISDNWVTFARTMSDRYHMILPDARNHGHSPHSDIFSFPAMEQDLMELLEELRLKKVTLIGHSMGGKTAICFTLNHPDQVDRLVVVDIGLRGYKMDQVHQQLMEAMMAVDFSKASSRKDIERQLEYRIHDTRMLRLMMKNVVWNPRKVPGWRLNLKGIYENLFDILEGIEHSGRFYGPVLFVRGGTSDYIKEEDWPAIKEKFPAAVLQTIAKASHWVHADAPEEFLGMVRSFLDQ